MELDAIRTASIYTKMSMIAILDTTSKRNLLLSILGSGVQARVLHMDTLKAKKECLSIWLMDKEGIAI